MSPRLGRVILIVSGMGFPLTQLVIRRRGARGAAVAEAVCGGLLIRDAAMLARGAPAKLRRGPAILLWLEAAAAALAVLTGLRPVVAADARLRASRRGPIHAGAGIQAGPDRAEALRRVAVGTLFGLHTMRFRIYLRPDHGLLATG